MNNAKTILLIIEDEDPILSALTTEFTKTNYNVLNAKDGKSGLDMAIQNIPDIILLDLGLPIMDGLSALRELRKTDVGKNIKVIVLSNSTDAQKLKEATELGAIDYIIKSDWELSEIINRVNREL